VSDESDGVQRWFAAANKRGHAGMFGRPTNAEKPLVERQTVQEWAQSLAAQGDIIDSIRSSERDPPDCLASLNGVPISIELAELLHGNVLHRIAAARRGAATQPSWDELQWTRDLFKENLCRIIQTKHTKLSRAELDAAATVLLVYSDEPWLTAKQVEQWCGECAFEPPPTIGRADLLLTYDPGYGPNWPVFKLF
jgi:hypothetical protein